MVNFQFLASINCGIIRIRTAQDDRTWCLSEYQIEMWKKEFRDSVEMNDIGTEYWHKICGSLKIK